MGPRAGLDGCGKSHPAPGFDPQAFQPVVSRYAVCPIPASLGLEVTTIQVSASVMEICNTECGLCSCRNLMTIAIPLHRTITLTSVSSVQRGGVLESRCVLFTKYVGELNRLKT